MFFFDTEKDHAVVPADGTGEGGRVAPKVTPTPLDVEVCGGDGRPPGSSVKCMLKAPAYFGAKKDIPIPHDYHFKQDKRS